MSESDLPSPLKPGAAWAAKIIPEGDKVKVDSIIPQGGREKVPGSVIAPPLVKTYEELTSTIIPPEREKINRHINIIQKTIPPPLAKTTELVKK